MISTRTLPVRPSSSRTASFSGVPTAADPPALREAWRKAFSRKWLAKDRVIPVLEPQTGRARILKKAPRKISDMNYLNGAWSGAATFSGGPYNGVIGYWKAPTVSKAPSLHPGPGLTTLLTASRTTRRPGSALTGSTSPRSFRPMYCRRALSSTSTPRAIRTTLLGMSGLPRATLRLRMSTRRTFPPFRSTPGMRSLCTLITQARLLATSTWAT
jgi:hypothetical protein